MHLVKYIKDVVRGNCILIYDGDPRGIYVMITPGLHT